MGYGQIGIIFGERGLDTFDEGIETADMTAGFVGVVNVAVRTKQDHKRWGGASLVHDRHCERLHWQ